MFDLLSELGRFLFVAYFSIAFLMWRADTFPGQRWMVAGFMLMGIPGLTFFVAREFMFDNPGLTGPLWFAGVASLIIGAWQWSSGGRSGAGFRSSIAVAVLGDQSTSNIPRNDDNSVTKAEAVRDSIYESLTTACQSEGVDAAIFRSPPHNPSVWVRAEISVPVSAKPNLTLRSSVRVEIHRHEFHRYERLLTVALNDSKKSKTYHGVIQLTSAHALAIVRYLAGKTKSKSFGFHQARTFPFQLWRPKNKMQAMKPAISIPGILAGVGLVLLSIPPVGLTVLAIGAVVWWVQRERRRRVYSLTTGKPQQEPRILLRMDSWQTVVNGLGGYRDEVRSDLLTALTSQNGQPAVSGESGTEKMLVEEERVWYEGIDGNVERDQVVVRLGRAIAFVYVYPYGDDLYVGWDAHLNGGMWTERLLKQGVAAGTTRPSRAYGIIQGWHTPNDYDIADANFLLEWVHALVTKVVRKALRGHQIDQEIDFTIVRESRQSLAGSENPQAGKAKRFRRVG